MQDFMLCLKCTKLVFPLHQLFLTLVLLLINCLKFLVSIFSHVLVNNLYTTRNSSDFVKKNCEFMPQGYTVVSFDVKSLCTNSTNVPEEGLKIVSRLCEFYFSSLEIDELILLTRTCLNQTTLTFVCLMV
jgi:hypothetical protein